ncbi:cell division protein ZapE [Methylobacterium isbiliense]|uniref:Cell division protein ZapE n=1 Tax=Methylobacterium isbiliense TaxID=315478 RepID=A0ABQ4S7I8_9HYPH|nr:cell division protein ZapE [Methylobacterium isbiliense]MDN3622276.1 cell division protein ZapE [Methylobacterium isbiliense]GJD98434.1 Cell division protein ZapE [Methylobacterium isbiliense]
MTHSPVFPASAGPVAARYDALVESGAIERDPAQTGLVAQLDALIDTLERVPPAEKPGVFGRLFGRRPEPAAAPKGLYVWGLVGRGKTMLMDLFHEAAPGPKRRVHFHAFMGDVHDRIHRHRQAVKAGEAKGDDPIAPVAEALAEEARLLCFDEFTVTDIADAMILGRLFTALFGHGVVMVATSNVAPDRLYEGGLNRALFLPFIGLLLERVEVVRLDSRTDFRLEKLGGSPVYHVPADEAAAAALTRAFRALTGRAQGSPATIAVKGHEVWIPEAAAGVARFTFADLCALPLGAADYLALAERFHTLIVEAIPVMGLPQRNEAKRFITLVDALYDTRTKLLASAQAEPVDLYRAESGRELFEFERTASRLIEMRSEEYLALPHGRPDSEASGRSTGLVET